MARLTSWLERYIFVSWMILAGTGIIALYWALDRSPPFVLGTYTVFNAPPGETMFLNANVERASERDCAVRFSRYLVDSNKVRHEIVPAGFMLSTALKDLERESPNQLRIALRVPVAAAPGPGALVTNLEYQCNPLHSVWPIDVLLRMDIEVLR